ncbi:hypothetical protein N7510_011612 [Penicillium lagena]|uniref:uncharacterized protein n=1 Tax=Penicillium lagena TaxID=94218 RepID=UPI00253F9DED|nr:uncharacterized protein N7510_011612 [Penicillium lagena]KAJ5602078.1 hypothetical protein N7510_011612 [Penicillium lagena]
MFQLAKEIPQSFVSSRWWEHESQSLLSGYDVQTIRQSLRWGLFDNQEVPRQALLARDESVINQCLVISDLQLNHYLLSFQQKVEEILRRSKTPYFQPTSQRWFLQPLGYDHSDKKIASEIEVGSRFYFNQISFEDLVRASLGHPAPSVEWFLQQHTTLYFLLKQHLCAKPEDAQLYAKVEKHLRDRCPFGHRALVQCLLDVGCSTGGMSPSTTPGFQFLAGPIQCLFQHPFDFNRPLSKIFEILNVLAVRFQQQYNSSKEINWHLPFCTDVLFFEYLTSESAEDHARDLTMKNSRDLTNLLTQDLEWVDIVKSLVTNWNDLSFSVWECCSGLPELIPYIQKCAKALYVERNYHSMTAILDGLREYNLSRGQSNCPSSLYSFMDPTDNYKNYLVRYYSLDGGIPFIFAHSEYELHGTTGPLSLRNFLQSTLPIDQINEHR